MATITIYGNTLSCGLGIGSFAGIGSAFNNAKQSVGSLVNALGTLKSKIECAQIAADVDTSKQQAGQAKEREENKQSALTLAYDKLDKLIADVGTVDANVALKITQLKNDFYSKYYYLKPECEKNISEKANDLLNSIWDGICDIGKAIKDFAIGLGEWCRQHVKEIITGVIVLISVAILFMVPGGGLLWAVLLGAAKGCLWGIATSVAVNGFINVCSGRNFFEGVAEAAFSGAISGFIGGGIAGGFFGNAATMGKNASKGLLKAAHSFKGAVGQGAMVGAITSSASNVVVTGVEYWMENGTLKGAGGTILQNALIGAALGGVIGGISGAASYGLQKFQDYRFNKNNQDAFKRGDISFRQMGDKYEEYGIQRLSKTNPDANIKGQITAKSDTIQNAQGTKPIGVRFDTVMESKVGSGNEMRFFEFKSSETASFQTNQKIFYANNGNKLVSDMHFTKAGITAFGNQTISAGTAVNVVRPSNFASTIGVKLSPFPLEFLSPPVYSMRQYIPFINTSGRDK